MKRVNLKSIIFFLLSITALFVFSCDTDILNLLTASDLEDELTFRAQKATDYSWYDVPAIKLAEGSKCIVYAEKAEDISVAIANSIVTEYESRIHSKITDAFGAIKYMPRNKNKIVFLLLDIIDGFDIEVGGGYVAGYFDPTHMFSSITSPNSNSLSMLFLDTNPGLKGPDMMKKLYGTIAHELQHLINFSQTYLKNEQPQDLWINEGLSSGAEHIYGGPQNDRVSYFNNDPSKTIAYGNNFFVWNNREDALADYATVYLFFQWLRIHASNGVGIYKEIINSNYRDYRTITSAASKRIDNKFNNWGTLLSTWMLANYFKTTNDFYGYKNQITTSISYPAGISSNSSSLYPGEGIFSNLGGSSCNPSVSGTNIRYIAFSSTVASIDTVAPYQGQKLLTYNANADKTADKETGYVANTLTTLMKSSMLNTPAADNQLPKIYPVDFHTVNNGSKDTLLKQKPTGN